MKFFRNYWLEILMITPLFLYIFNFTFIPVVSNINKSFIDQEYGRKISVLAERIKGIKDDIENASDKEEREEYLEELEKAEQELQDLKEQGNGYSLSNYRALFKSRVFRKSIFNTLAITVTGLIFQFMTAMGIALFLTQKFRGKGIFRTIVLTPLGIPTIVAATIMTYIFDTRGYLT